MQNKAKLKSLYLGVLYCTWVSCTVPGCTVLYLGELYCTKVYCTVPRCTVLYLGVLYCTWVYSTVPRCTVLYQCVLYYTCTLYCTVPVPVHCTIPGCTVLYSGVLYCTWVYCTGCIVSKLFISSWSKGWMYSNMEFPVNSTLTGKRNWLLASSSNFLIFFIFFAMS